MLNKYLKPLRRIDLVANPAGNAELLQGVYTMGLLCRLSGSITVAGGAASGTVVAEGVERLIRQVRVVKDQFHLVNPIQGRELRALTRRMVANIPAADRLANADAQVATPISTYFVIPFARPYLADPFETVLPPLAVENEFHVYFDLDETTSNAASDPGSGALITGGDRTVTIDSLHIDVVQEYARKGKAPAYLPIISVQQSPMFNAATDALPFDLRNINRWDAVLLHTLEATGTTRVNADLINYLTMLSGGTRFLDRVPIEILSAMEQTNFPSVGSRAAGESDETGYDFLLMADNGKLGNVVDPRGITQPAFEFNVDAPAVGNGQIRAVFMELVTQEGVTAVQETR